MRVTKKRLVHTRTYTHTHTVITNERERERDGGERKGWEGKGERRKSREG